MTASKVAKELNLEKGYRLVRAIFGSNYRELPVGATCHSRFPRVSGKTPVRGPSNILKEPSTHGSETIEVNPKYWLQRNPITGPKRKPVPELQEI